MRGPARVADAVRAVDGGLPDYFLRCEVFPVHAGFPLCRRADYGDSCGIIAAIFQPPQAVEDERNDFLGADISDDSHTVFSPNVGARHRKAGLH